MDPNNQNELWRESFFDICASPTICCKGTFCTDCLFGENVAKITGGSCCSYCCVYLLLSPLYLCGLVHMKMRARMREKYGLQEEPSDFIAACLLSPIGVCQEAREIMSREQISNGNVKTKQPSKGVSMTSNSEAGSVSNTSHGS